MDPIDPLTFVRNGLREAGPKAWEGIARSTGKSVFLLRKLAYNDRKNPRLDTLQPLVNYFSRKGRK